MDIGLSNASLQFITLAFYSMSLVRRIGWLIVALCKSSSLGFVLVFAFFFRLEKVELKLILVIATITIGVILMVATETEFVLTGYPSPSLPLTIPCLISCPLIVFLSLSLSSTVLMTDLFLLLLHRRYRV